MAESKEILDAIWQLKQELETLYGQLPEDTRWVVRAPKRICNALPAILKFGDYEISVLLDDTLPPDEIYVVREHNC